MVTRAKCPLIISTSGEEGQPDFWESLRQSSGITKSVIIVLATFVNIKMVAAVMSLPSLIKVKLGNNLQNAQFAFPRPCPGGQLSRGGGDRKLAHLDDQQQQHLLLLLP